MELFKMRKKCKDQDLFWHTWWVKWFENRVRQGCLFHAIIPAHSTF